MTRVDAATTFPIWSISVALLALTPAGCDYMRLGSTCRDTLTCPKADAGGAAGEGPGGTTSGETGGGVSVTGGGRESTAGGPLSSTIGGQSSATSAGSSGTGGSSALPCAGACNGDTPVCDEATDTCVECLENPDCTEGVCNTETHECVQCLSRADCSGNAPACDTNTNLCVACLENSDCSDAMPFCNPEEQSCAECLEDTDCTESDASWCDAGSCAPCQTNDDCAHLTGTTVCDAEVGQCVECTGTDYESCGTLDGTPLVCDSLERTCTSNKHQAAGLCNACVSDAHCKPGQLCVNETLEGTQLGYRCFWQPGAEGAPAGCPVAQPYVTLRSDVTSIDGVAADVCTLAISSCKAHEDFRNTDCEAAPDVPDPSLCGEPGIADSGCELFGVVAEDNIYRCTVRCGSDDDCRVGFACDISASSPVCFLNP